MEQGVFYSQCWRTALSFILLSIALWSATAFSQEADASTATACPSFNYTTHSAGPPKVATPEVLAPSDETVIAHLQPGLLKPQVEAFIKQGFAVDHVDWRASPHYRWSTSFEFSAANWQQALTQILRPYQLQLTLYANRTAVVAASSEVRP
ncbi:hypothetical protein [Pseudidiomarina sp.]|uniref:hypothetical protein n=1 Tax=Pseudidiomarina sp. TaxID=2081707 RepID=UPI003A980159